MYRLQVVNLMKLHEELILNKGVLFKIPLFSL